jgi:predicted oxidoreductase
MRTNGLTDLYSSDIVFVNVTVSLSELYRISIYKCNCVIEWVDFADYEALVLLHIARFLVKIAANGKIPCFPVYFTRILNLELNLRHRRLVWRKNYILQTKCGIRKNAEGKINRFDFSREYILSAAEASLKRLNADYIDILLLHRPDTLIEPDEVAEAFEKLRSEGKVRAFGVSNFSAMQMELLRKWGVEMVANQMQFALGHTAPVDTGLNVNMYKDESTTRSGDAMEYCRVHGIAMQAWSPLQYGFFEGVFLGNEKFPALNAELNRLAEKYNCTPAAIAFAWVLRHPAFKQAVTGTASPEHMAQICEAGDIVLTRDEWYSLYASTGRILP